MLLLRLAVMLLAGGALGAERPAPAPSPLSARGWDLWNISAHLPALERARAIETASAFMGQKPQLLLWERSKGWIAPGPDGPDPERIVERFAASVDGSLRRALPGEALALQSIQLRAARGEPAAGRYIHPDGGWVTVTHALKGAGTILYPIEDGLPSELHAGSDIAVITGLDRQLKLGRPATIHSAPQDEEHADRLLLLARYRLADFSPAAAELYPEQQKAALREELVREHLRSLGRRVYDLSDEIARLGRRLIPKKTPR